MLRFCAPECPRIFAFRSRHITARRITARQTLLTRSFPTRLTKEPQSLPPGRGMFLKCLWLCPIMLPRPDVGHSKLMLEKELQVLRPLQAAFPGYRIGDFSCSDPGNL